MPRTQPPSPEFTVLQRALAGRYSLVREIGRGGMGVVFLAADLALDRPVAVKMLSFDRSGDPEERRRFVREARIAARLSHPHIVPIHAAEEVEDIAYFVMGWVDGDSIGDLIRQSGPLPPAVVQRLMLEVAWALSQAHAHGVIHRDIKPDNVIVERGSGRALVLDFGIALDHRDTSQAGIAGTPLWMSPEQATGRDLDGRSDLYSLGLVAWFALAGRAPAPDAMREAGAAPPAPPALAEIVQRCVMEDPAARFASADELAHALRDADARRDEVTPRIRSYLQLARSGGSEVAAVGTAAVAAGAMLTASLMQPASGLFGAISTAIDVALFAGVGAAMVGLATARVLPLVARARELVRDGYDIEAVSAATTRLELEEAAPGPAGGSAGTAVAGRVALGIAGTAGAYWLASGDVGMWSALLGVAGAIAVPTATVRAVATQLARRGSPVPGRAFSAFNRAIFRVARILGRRGAAPMLPTSGRPTVAALGRDATAILAALPAGVRDQFREVPSLVRRLESVAQAAPASVPDERRQQARIALDTLRLELMRLQAGLVTSADFTRELDRVRGVGEDVQRVLEARQEVDDLLARPRTSP